MVGAVAGSGVVAGSVDALAHLQAVAAGLSSLSLVPYARGDMSAEISTFTELSPQTLAGAVWNAIASQYVTTGTMGKLLNASGGGSDPETIAAAVWAIAPDQGLTTEQATMLLELFALMGLDPTKPLVVTPTARTVGNIAQTIAADGDAVTVTRS